jgi:cytochrome b561
MLRNTPDGYGLVAILLHWLTALAILGLFAMGLWMTGLDYYHPWYHRAPEIHKAVGTLLGALLLLRLLWRLGNPRPLPEPTHSAFERYASRVAHALLYALPFAVIGAGYLISTADGQPIEVFALFAVPATLTGLPEQADRAGDVHLALAIALVAVAGIHALAALKHHFIDHDRTLLRMLRWRAPRTADNPPTNARG